MRRTVSDRRRRKAQLAENWHILATQASSKKVTILGGSGTVGSALAFHLGAKNVVSEIVLIDTRHDHLRAHVMDLEQALSPISTTRVRMGTYSDLAGSAIVIIACSAAETGSVSRMALLDENLALIRAAGREINEHCRDAVVLTITNPVDVLNYVLWKEMGVERSRCLGFSTNDSLRFRWAIAAALNVASKDVHALVVGEHGPHQVPLFSSIAVKEERVSLSKAQRSAIVAQLEGWFGDYTSLRSGRTTGWTSAVGAAKLVEQVLMGSSEVLATSVVPDGEYGLTALSIGLPIRLGVDGVATIEPLSLAASEMTALREAGERIRRTIIEVEC